MKKLKEMNKKTRIILGIGILLVVILATTFAYYQLVYNQAGDGIGGTVRCFDINFKGSDAINIPAALPITDEEGLKTDPYIFTITNTCDMEVGFQVNLEVLASSTMDLNFIKYNIAQASAPLGSAPEGTSTIANSNSKSMATGQLLNRNESVTYNLRLWMDASAAPAEDYYDLVKGKTFAARVSVVSTAIRGGSERTPSSAFNVDLDRNMIPIMWHNNQWVKANINNTGEYKWYDYDAFQWANAVIVTEETITTYRNNAVGSPVPE